MENPHQPFVVKTTSARDIILGVLVGVAVLGFILWGILSLAKGLPPNRLLTGRIISKHFHAQPEEQLSIGQGGLQAQHIDGQYTLEVAVPGDKTYTVWVDKTVFNARQVGDELSFLPPPAPP